MTKSSKIRIALTVLALAAFTAVFFSIPALRIKRFWFAYGCGVFAILWQIYAIIVTILAVIMTIWIARALGRAKEALAAEEKE